MIRQACATSIRALGNNDNECEAVLMTDSLARDGHIIDPAGMLLANYQRNPIVLWQHQPGFPVGTASGITRYSDRIAARITFAPAGVSSTADEVRGLVKNGVVTAMSIGFDVLDADPLDPKKPRGGMRITRSELLECSFVSVPADPGATVTARAFGMPSRQDVLVASATNHIGAALGHHRSIGDCLDRGAMAATERPLQALRDRLRAGGDALGEAVQLGVPVGDEPLMRAVRHVGAARRHHVTLGDAIGRKSAVDAEDAHRPLGRALRGARSALRELGGLTNLAGPPRAAPAHFQHFQEAIVTSRSYHERQVEKLRLRVAAMPAAVAPFSPAGGPAAHAQRLRDAELERNLFFIRASRPGPGRDLTERRRAVEALRRAP